MQCRHDSEVFVSYIGVGVVRKTLKRTRVFAANLYCFGGGVRLVENP